MTSAIVRGGHRRPEGRESLLLGRAQQGDSAAFEELAGAHVERLFLTAFRLVGDRGQAEDVVQESLLRAWRGIARFGRRSQFATWLYRITVNEASRALQQGARRPETIGLDAEQLQVSAPSDAGPARQAEYRELCVTLRAALLALPLAYRAAVVLRDVEGLSTREAAKIVGVSEAAFKSRLHQARMEVRATLGDEYLIAAAG
jgi:RNA polymerase sigma-70 factor (ECF subfamily)